MDVYVVKEDIWVKSALREVPRACYLIGRISRRENGKLRACRDARRRVCSQTSFVSFWCGRGRGRGMWMRDGREGVSLVRERHSGIWGRRWWTRMLKCRSECGVLPLFAVMSFVGAKWLWTSKGGISPDGKAAPLRALEARKPLARAFRARALSACASEVDAGWNALIKINLGYSYFHKVSARKRGARPISRALKASARFLADLARTA